MEYDCKLVWCSLVLLRRVMACSLFLKRALEIPSTLHFPLSTGACLSPHRHSLSVRWEPPPPPPPLPATHTPPFLSVSTMPCRCTMRKAMARRYLKIQITSSQSCWKKGNQVVVHYGNYGNAGKLHLRLGPAHRRSRPFAAVIGYDAPYLPGFHVQLTNASAARLSCLLPPWLPQHHDGGQLHLEQPPPPAQQARPCAR
jgi:hypothetical protein